MNLNKTDEKALKWIVEQEDVKTTDVIKGDCPDFTLRNGNSYEAKRLYGKNVLLFTQNQYDILRVRDNCRLLVFDDGSEQPTEVISCKDLGNGKWSYEIKIVDDLGIRANVWLSRTLYSELEKTARQEGLETNDLIREVLEEYVSRKSLSTKEE